MGSNSGPWDGNGAGTLPVRGFRRMDEVLKHRDLFHIDLIACSQAASRISSCEWPFAGAVNPLSRERALITRLAVSAVCHQFNWDFLTTVLEEELSAMESPADSLAKVSADIVRKWLDGYPKPERIREKERASLLRNLGRTLRDSYNGSATNLLDSAAGRLQGKHGLMARLDEFESFRKDPLRKKSNVFVHELVRERLARFEDEEAIAPAIDYHIMRIYLRSGRVVPAHIEIFEALRGRHPPRGRLVNVLRNFVAEALRQTAFYAKLPIPDVNYVEWQLGRNVCRTQEPNCARRTDISDPVLEELVSKGCPLADFCLALRDSRWFLSEPGYKGSFF